MRCDILPLSSLRHREVDAWRDLAARAIVPNPFAEPGFAMPAAQRLHVRDAGVLVVLDGSDWMGAVPVRSVSRWRRVPGRYLTVWRHPYCFLGTPLLAAGHPDATLAEMLRRATREPGTLAFALDLVDADGPFGEALATALPTVGPAPLVIDAYERAFLHRRSDGDYLESTVSSRHRKELRRTRRLLEAEVGPLVVRDVAGDEQAPARFLELERGGWKGRVGTAMACIPDHADLLADLCRGWASAGRLQMLSLQTDTRVVAMACNVSAAAGSFRFKIAFDEELARFSPGIHLEIGLLEAFHNGDASWMDSCADPRNKMIHRLWAPRRQLQNLIISSSGARGAIGHGIWTAARAGRDLSQRFAQRRSHVAHHGHR